MTEDLDKWFKEKWVNIGKKVDGKHPPCGTSGEKSGYAKCVPAAKAASMSKKEKESATRRKRAAQNDADRGGKDSKGQGKTPIYVSTKPKNEEWSQKYKNSIDCNNPKGFSQKAHCAGKKKNETISIEEKLNLFLEKNVPTDPTKWAASKAAAKAKFDVYPSAYANGWAAKNYKSKGGGWRKSNENLAELNTIREEVSNFRKIMLLENLVQEDGANKLKETLNILKNKKKVLILSCSNRYNWDDKNIDIPKSKIIATYLKEELGDNCTFIDVSELNISSCEGNVSRKEGNQCGIKEALLKNDNKNPSGYHRCWASINNKEDELWKISKELFESDAVIFFSSIRWGQTNMYYQKLIERLTWIENRHTTLKEKNIVENIETGFICVGQNWNGEEVTKVQMKVHEFYGFKPNKNLYWNWQYTKDDNDENQSSYKKSHKKFIDDMNLEDIY